MTRKSGNPEGNQKNFKNQGRRPLEIFTDREGEVILKNIRQLVN